MADYTKGMSALHHILTQIPMNTTLSKKGQLPPFTASHLKAGLRTSWTAEQIGRLAIKYESEWYADSSLSKWNEIDHFYQTTCENKRQRILAELDECHITKPAEREYPLKLLSEQYQSHIDTWQIEKAQRIKPSLWWDEVAKAQVSQTANTDTATTDNTPVLSNLSLDGKAWYLHPVGVLELSNIETGIVFNVIIDGIEDKYIISYESYNDLILHYEGYSSRPYVPNFSNTSGISLGYGYDLGHQSRAIALTELSSVYTSEQVERLLEGLGKKGEQARVFLPSVSDITISKDNAKRLSIISKVRYAQQVVNIYPESIRLSTDQKGALLSLIYNRGNSLKGERRKEMREIQDKLKNNELHDIPNLFRSMKRLWIGSNQSGLLKRRENEAVFFEKGLF